MIEVTLRFKTEDTRLVGNLVKAWLEGETVDITHGYSAGTGTTAVLPTYVREREVDVSKKNCNLCLRPVLHGDDPGNGLCGPCNRFETPESQEGP